MIVVRPTTDGRAYSWHVLSAARRLLTRGRSPRPSYSLTRSKGAASRKRARARPHRRVHAGGAAKVSSYPYWVCRCPRCRDRSGGGHFGSKQKEARNARLDDWMSFVMIFWAAAVAATVYVAV